MAPLILRAPLMWLGVRPQVSASGERLERFGLPYFWFWIQRPIVWWRLR